jgi:glycosyltransferase involved in cell wall biosynthesis
MFALLLKGRLRQELRTEAVTSTMSEHGRILCVTSNFPRWEGDSTTPFVLHLAEDLHRIGWQVDILAPHAPGAATEETLSGLHIKRFRYLWPESQETVCYQGGALINLRHNPLDKLKLPALVGAELTAVSQRLLARRYDMLHSHWILPQGFAGMIARTLKAVPHVITVHGGDVFGLQGPMLARAKRAALRSADAVTINSSVTEAAVLELAPDLESVHRIPMGVSTNPLSRNKTRLAERIRSQHRHGAGPLVVFVGRLVEEKGVEDLLQALPMLAQDLPDLAALVIGQGQNRAELENLASTLGITNRVTFTGWVDSKDISAYLAASDVFVGPSRRAKDGWVEAQGLTFLEAMAVGTPVIATRLGGVVDSVRDRETGLLVDERSPEQIADAIRRIASEPELVETVTTRAKHRVTAHFSREASAAAFSQLFLGLTQKGRAGGRT